MSYVNMFTDVSELPIGREGDRLYREIRVSNIANAIVEEFPRFDSRIQDTRKLAENVFDRSWADGHANGRYAIDAMIEENLELVLNALDLVVKSHG